MARLYRRCVAVATVASVLLLTSCLHVQLVERYDPTIEVGVTAYETTMLTYYAEVEHGVRSGALDGDAKKLYAVQATKLRVLLNRAIADRGPTSCRLATAAAKTVKDAVLQRLGKLKVAAKLAGTAAGIVADVEKLADDDSLHDCTDLYLSLLLANHAVAMQIHDQKDDNGAPRPLNPVKARSNATKLSAAVRDILSAELAKKRADRNVGND